MPCTADSLCGALGCCLLQEHVRVRIQRQLSRLQRPDYIQTLEVGLFCRVGLSLANPGCCCQPCHRTTAVCLFIPLRIGA